MRTGRVNFDRLARIYRLLEFLAFGRDLERARFAFLDRLADRNSILVLGEGDGRCLARLVRLTPLARIRCIDSSRAMLDRAKARLDRAGGKNQVTFECADVVSSEFPAETYDAVVTLFFLDCFEADTAKEIVERVSRSLRPDAVWLCADFALPERGFARWRARAWLALLYFFFRWETGLATRTLPPSEALIELAGFFPQDVLTLQAGLLRSVFFRRTLDPVTTRSG